MKTVKIYKLTTTKSPIASIELGTHFSLSPCGENTPMIEGYDDGGKEYILPEGYELSETKHDEKAIFLKEKYCHILSEYGKPVLVSSDEISTTLKQAKHENKV